MAWDDSATPKVARQVLVDRLLAGYLPSDSHGISLVDHTVVGNVLYTVLEHPHGYTFIRQHLMQAPQHGDPTRWDYHIRDEGTADIPIQCPEKLLAQSTAPGELAAQWRADTRAARDDQAARKRKIKKLKRSERLAAIDGSEVIFLRAFTASVFIGRAPDDAEDDEYEYLWEDIDLQASPLPED
ncbi:hypothetical protein [Cobetia crustatorum]|uniref:hypothetical protein n=1 Tax=Cobetia crustatorum TaxID=553385 RepID=UPI000468D09D|nr:hypothetical protein [Cobetia crustatorum]